MRFGQLLRRLLLLVTALLPRALRARMLLLPFRKDQARLVAARRQVPTAQLSVLREILSRNQRTEFGIAHGFAQIDDLARFRKHVPARTLEQFAPYLARQRAGEEGVILAERVEALLSDEHRGQRPCFPAGATALAHRTWIDRLLRRAALARAADIAGTEWLDLLPVHEPVRGDVICAPPAAVLAYRHRAAAVPPEVFTIEDEVLRFYLVLRLTLNRPIGVLRANAPGTLAILAHHLEQQAERVIGDLARGTISFQEQLDRTLVARLPPLPPDPHRAEQLRAINKTSRLRPRDAWPRLCLLVCPTTHTARAAAERLPDRFGPLPIIDPGRGTAEAPMTLPFEGQGAGELITGGLFWEFFGEKDEDPVTLEELRPGQRCVPVLTAPNGLYRYAMNVIVEVLDRRAEIPLLAPLGQRPYRLELAEGVLTGEQLAAAVSGASRRCGLLLSGYTAWWSDPAARQQGRDAADETGEAMTPSRGWLRRLFSSASQSQSRPARPALVIAIEPAVELDDHGSRELVGAIDRELEARCPAYAASRKQRLASMRGVVLKRGALARMAHARLARGLTEGHTAAAPLAAEPPPLAEEEISSEVGEE